MFHFNVNVNRMSESWVLKLFMPSASAYKMGEREFKVIKLGFYILHIFYQFEI